MCVGVGSGEVDGCRLHWPVTAARKPERVEIQGRVQGWVRGSVRFCEFAARDREANSGSSPCCCQNTMSCGLVWYVQHFVGCGLVGFGFS